MLVEAITPGSIVSVVAIACRWGGTEEALPERGALVSLEPQEHPLALFGSGGRAPERLGQCRLL